MPAFRRSFKRLRCVVLLEAWLVERRARVAPGLVLGAELPHDFNKVLDFTDLVYLQAGVVPFRIQFPA
jgi:hypothetical protein